MSKVDLVSRLGDARERLASAEASAPESHVPKYARLTRKEARVREDQYAALSALARTLMRRRQAKPERITENTLIRVAIDLLLAHEHELRGATEDELRNSVTPGPRDVGTSALREVRTSGLPDDLTPHIPNASGTTASDSHRGPVSGQGLTR